MDDIAQLQLRITLPMYASEFFVHGGEATSVKNVFLKKTFVKQKLIIIGDWIQQDMNAIHTAGSVTLQNRVKHSYDSITTVDDRREREKTVQP